MVAVISAIFLIILIREVKAEYAIFAVIILGVFILMKTVPAVSEILIFTKKIIPSNIEDSHIAVLYKAVGSAFLCQYVSDICRECGMDSISSKTEMFGKIYLTLLCLPLIETILDTVITV